MSDKIRVGAHERKKPSRAKKDQPVKLEPVTTPPAEGTKIISVETEKISRPRVRSDKGVTILGGGGGGVTRVSGGSK